MSNSEERKKGFDWKKEARSWAVILGIFGLLYVTGLHTEVIGRVQQLMLWTGIFQPEMTEPAPGSDRAEAQWDYHMKRLDGEEVSLSDYRGKVVFLNFWASWCPPCVAEMPNIQGLYDSLKDDEDIVFLMISLDQKVENARNFVQNRDFTFPVYMPISRRPGQLQSDTVPTTYVINPQGWVVLEHQGMADYDTEAFRSYLQKLKNQSDPPTPEDMTNTVYSDQ